MCQAQRRTLLLFSILLLSTLSFLAAAAAAAAHQNIVELTSSNFDEKVFSASSSSSGSSSSTNVSPIWMVAFIAPWCGHCQRLHPEYEKAAKSLGGVVNLGQVNCDNEKELAQRFGIRGFPTIKIFSAGAKNSPPEDYQYQRTAGAIVKTLLDKFDALKDPVRKLSSVQDVKSFFGGDDSSSDGANENENDKTTRVVLVSSKETNPKLFKSIAIEFSHNKLVQFGFVPSSALPAMKEAAATGDSSGWASSLKTPALFLYPSGKSITKGDAPVMYTESKMQKDSMMKFIQSHVVVDKTKKAGANGSSANANANASESREVKVQVESIPNMERLKKYCFRMCVLAVPSNNDEDKKLRKQQEQLVYDLAQQYGRRDKFKFAIYDGSDVAQIKTLFGVEDSQQQAGESVTVPLVVLRAGKNKYATASAVSKSTAAPFFDQIVGGGIKFSSFDDKVKPAGEPAAEPTPASAEASSSSSESRDEL